MYNYLSTVALMWPPTKPCPSSTPSTSEHRCRARFQASYASSAHPLKRNPSVRPVYS